MISGVRWLLLVLALGSACASERPVETAQEPTVDSPIAQVQAPAVPKLPPPPAKQAASKPWTFAVL